MKCSPQEKQQHQNIDVVLSEEQIEAFLEDGVLVVENILSADQVQQALAGVSQTLARVGVDTECLSRTGHGLQSLSSTNGSGGVLDVFYEDWKWEIATNPKLFAATTQLWQAAFCHQGESQQDLSPQNQYQWHPYGPFDCEKGYCYIDRVGYRLPTELATKLGEELSNTKSKKKKKSLAIQRSLTPHLDCCPPEFFSLNKTKWRPIQCFVSLSDTTDPNHGGFEAAKGFHRHFHEWVHTRPPSTRIRKQKQQVKGKLVVTEQLETTPAACVGEYTHIRPVEDAPVLQQVQPILPVPAGSAVFFDNRIPHANAYYHHGKVPRCVVYCSFLPDVEINRHYAQQQLQKWQHGIPPNDQWIGEPQPTTRSTPTNSSSSSSGVDPPWMTPLARKLLKLDPW